MATKEFPATDGFTGGMLRVEWEPGAARFSGWIAAPDEDADRVSFDGSSPYLNEQGGAEQDNGVATSPPLPNSHSTFRIRVLYITRGDGSIFSTRGDVIYARKPNDGFEGSWQKAGNLLE